MEISSEFQLGVKRFVNWCVNYSLGTANELRCPCAKCKNKRYLKEDDVKLNHYKSRFLPNYYNWIAHGEPAYGYRDCRKNKRCTKEAKDNSRQQEFMKMK